MIVGSNSEATSPEKGTPAVIIESEELTDGNSESSRFTISKKHENHSYCKSELNIKRRMWIF